MRLPLARASLAVVLAAGIAAMLAGRAATARDARAATAYRVTAATATATLTFSGGVANASFERGRADVTISLRKTKTSSKSSLGSRGGQIRFPITARYVEQVRFGGKTGGATSPYVEDQCGDRKTAATVGALTLVRVGSKMRVAWGLPHAGLRLCPGPKGTGPSLKAKMTRTLSASTFSRGKVTVRLSGSTKFTNAAKTTTGTYRWRATVTLVRV